ncbi:SPOR domain-containing protein [Pseudorhodoplanes sp.]|uniref:SPOR domain-containing protein n=1 Tax=Pseudorhodoplanes sp. TaxID=1934341 RepID=UPI00391B8DBE
MIGQQNEPVPSYRQIGTPSPYEAEPAGRGWVPPGGVARQSGYPASGAESWRSGSDGAAGYGDGRYDAPGDFGASQPAPDHAEAGYQAAAYAAAPEQDYADPRFSDPRYDQDRYPVEPPAGGRAYTAADYREAGYNEPGYSELGYGAPDYDQRGYANSYGADERPADRTYAARSYAAPSYGEPSGIGPRYGAGEYSDPRYSDPHFSDAHHTDPSLGATRFAPHDYARPDNAAGYDSYSHYDRVRDGGASSYGAPPVAVARAAAGERILTKRPRNLVTVLAVLALAVVGTASAFGYRAMVSAGGTAVPAPVIKADTQPAKIVPSADPNSKPIQDRIGVKTERIVPRQEEPVQQAAPGQPRVIAPFLAGPGPQAFPPANAAAPASPQTPAAIAEPKRIRTVPIRPEGGAEAPSAPSARPARAAAQPAPAAHHDDAGRAHAQAPLALAPNPAAMPAARTGAPVQTASIPAPGAAPFPAPITSEGANQAAPGPFAVQVTSQRSEAEARASFRSLQQQFPSVLGNRQPLIRRADLGERGTYYRAQIPFGSQTEANEFCSSLKSAGGQCVVQRN